MSDDLTHSVPPFQPVQPGGEPLPTLEPVRPTPPPKKRSPSGRWLNILLGVAAVIAIGGVAFAVGRSTAPAQAATFPGGGAGSGIFPGGSFDPNQAPGGANGGGFGGLGGGLTVEGTVKAVDGTSLTLTTAAGSDLTVTLDGNTTYREATSADATAVAAGDAVSVRVSGAGQFGAGGQGGAPGAGDGTGTPSFTATDVTIDR